MPLFSAGRCAQRENGVICGSINGLMAAEAGVALLQKRSNIICTPRISVRTPGMGR